MLLDKPLSELVLKVKAGQIKSTDIVEECYAQIGKHDSKINSFISLVPQETALKQAQYADQSSDDLPLKGIPFVLKDCFCTQGVQTTAASDVLKGFIPTYNATIYQKLLKAGAILIGKMNMDAWGHGGSNENTDFGPVKNPWNLSRVAGGSSGGPAAAITSRMTSFAIGEDTGGSIRNPAGWCNITGLKVTYGRVSRYGSIAYASSFDTVGPMAKTAADCALILEIIAGKDPYDATSSDKPVPAYSQLLDMNITGKTIGIPKEFFSDGLDPQIKATILATTKEFEKMGLVIKEISMPLFDQCLPVYYLIGPSETSSNLARYDGNRFGQGRNHFSPESVRRILIGTYALSAGYYDAYYKKAQQVRTLFINEYQKALSDCDILLQPIMPMSPPEFGQLINNPLQNLLADIYTVSQNPVGIPSLAIPCGFDSQGLPIGCQLAGRMFSEDLLLAAGHQYQQLTDYHLRLPPL